MSDPAAPTTTGGHVNNVNEKEHLDQTEPAPVDPAAKKETAADDDDEDEDIDALIEELESQDAGEEEEEQEAQPGGARTVPEELLQTDTRTGLTAQDVTTRRKKYGMNQMKEEKENLILKFLGFFVGPIQFVMEVCPHRLQKFNPVYIRS
jgi:H+-transporting ATPase